MSSYAIQQLMDSDLEAFVALTLRTYPRFGMPFEERGIGFREEIARQFKDPSITPMGIYAGETLAGVMRVFHFDMNFYGAVVSVLGLGSLAVDLPFKKQRLAKQMIDYFHETARDSGAFLTALYPFSPSFYRNLGYGYGSRAEEYRLSLSGLSKSISALQEGKSAGTVGDNLPVRFLESSDLQAVTECYNRMFEGNHGMFRKSSFQLSTLLGDGETELIVGALRTRGENPEDLAGYAAFHFVRGFDGPPEEDNIYLNDISVDELVYDSPEALTSLLAFFGRQADQAQHLVLRSQDRNLYHLFDDPGDRSHNVIPPAFHQCSKVGIGLMYRIVDVGRALAAYQKARGWAGDRSVEVAVVDKLIPANTGTYRLGPETTTARGPERVLTNVRELSSLLMGAVSLGALTAIGRVDAQPNDDHPTLDALFPGSPEPICLTGF